MARIRRIGFTLIEVVVALTVILILAAVALPTLAGYTDQKRVEAAAALLATVRDAIYHTDASRLSFRDDVGSNIGRLSQLSEPIVANNTNWATGSDDSCGTTFSNGQRNNWLGAGPFVNFVIDRNVGLVTPIGVAVDSVTRIPNSANPGRLRLNFLDGVDSMNVVMLDDFVDGNDGQNAGNVQWLLPASNGLLTMYYFVNIDDTC